VVTRFQAGDALPATASGSLNRDRGGGCRRPRCRHPVRHAGR
jgi:hypothetical protein